MLKLGFIGYGEIARYHTNVIRKSVPGIRIMAAADIRSEALDACRAATGATALYRDYRELLKKADVDAVCVALPTYLHAEAAVAAARAGKHVFCENPMARTHPGCDAMMDAAAKARVTLMIGQVRRYDADWGAWAGLVRDGAIGRPVLWRQTAGGPGPGRWFMDARMGAGPFMDGCVHNWDFANAVFGRPVEAVGSLMRLYGKSALDSGSVTVRYQKGDEVTLCWSWGMPKGVITRSATDILGPLGVISFPGSFPEEEFPKGFDRKRYGAYLVDTGKRKRLARFPKKDMFAEEWKDFARAVRTGSSPLVTGDIGRRAVAVCLAVLKAGETRRPVAIRI